MGKWRLVEEYGLECFDVKEDGKLFFRGTYSDMEGLIAWALTFGDRMEIIKPESARLRLLEVAKKMCELPNKLTLV